ncbi:MAG: type II toxin-antitoxin system VapC family toxin [Sulfuritalea sp.]|nr:type II toxin-antitoxin system VapC family toxin [Sulfuritalea sp.]
MKVFLDTSAFAKRYVAEQGSDKVLAMCQQADSLVVSVICLPELVSTLSRLVREKKLAKAAYLQLKRDAMADLADADVCQITSEVLASVVSLLELHPLRAMDALHVACALACKPDVFVSADHRQLSAARKAGLKVVDVS